MGKALTIPTQVLALPTDSSQPVRGLQNGIHITWNLPDGLARGVADPDETRGLTLPELPDRWLVMRINPPGADGTRTTKSWIVDSWRGTASLFAGGQQSPTGAVAGQRMTILGMMDTRGNFINPPDPQSGPGVEAFATYYPISRSRFGFYDPLGDVATGPLSYVVIGWYSDPARDPLGAAGTEWKRLQVMNQSGWRVDGVTFAAGTEAQIDRSVALPTEPVLPPGTTPKTAPPVMTSIPAPAPAAAPVTANKIKLKRFEPVPDHIIVHGMVVNVPLANRGGLFSHLSSPLPQPGRVDFTLGDSFGDALGSLLTDQNDMRWLFQVLQGGGLRSLQSLDALASIQAELHRQGFAAKEVPSAPGTSGGAAPGVDPASLFRSGKYWQAGTPLMMASNAGRGFRYGHDGRYEADGKVKCRITGQRVKSIGLKLSYRDGNLTRSLAREIQPWQVSILPASLSVLDPAVRELVEEALLLDPTSAPIAGNTSTGLAQTKLVAAFSRESTFWWTEGLDGIDPADVVDLTQYTGMLPSPLAMTPWTDPWVTGYLEYEAAFFPSTGPLVSSWPLGDVERSAAAGIALGTAPIVVRGMAPADDGAPSVLASMLGQLLATAGLEQELGDSNFAALQQKVRDLRMLNVLSFNLSGIDSALRQAGHAVRAGMLTFTSLRLVDAFGRKVELDRNRLRATPESWLSVGTTRGIAMPPRALRPGRVDFRLLAATDDTKAAAELQSPLCGFLAIDYVDRALEVYDAAGAGLGQLRIDGNAVVFEPAPGREALSSERGTTGAWNPHLGRVVQSLLDAGRVIASGRPDPLSSLLALIDAVRHTVDRRSNAEEHLAFLLGAPIAVVRARAALQIDPDAGSPAFEVTARLGSLAQLDDGLLGYVLDTMPGRIQTPLAPTLRLTEAGFGIDHALRDLPILAPGAEVTLTSDGKPVHMTLLLMPGSGVYASSGVYPRTRQTLTKEWLDEGLKRMVPTFAFGPLLVEPSRLQLPTPGTERFAWSWVHRTKPAGGTDGWDQQPVSPSNDRAFYPNGVVLVEDGWLTGRRIETP